MVRVLGIVLKLLATPKSRIYQAGLARAHELLSSFQERGVFEWAPQVQGWLAERSYVFCLGLGELFGP